MSSNRPLPVWLPLAMLGFAVLQLAFEHVTGGVQVHHVLAREDLPSISNWFALLVLPLLGGLVALRARAHPSARRLANVPTTMLAAMVAAIVYGAVLAISFELSQSDLTNAAFLGLFVLALLLPVYRIECLAGFVLGMTITFGPVLPLLVASIVALVSLILRGGGIWLWKRLLARGTR